MLSLAFVHRPIVGETVMRPSPPPGNLRQAARRSLRVLAVLVGVGLVGSCDDSSATNGALPDGPDLGTRFQAACTGRVPRLDCRCFWDEAASAFNHANMTPLIEVLTVREQWSGQITRARVEQLAGPDGARVVSRALYNCVKL